MVKINLITLVDAIEVRFRSISWCLYVNIVRIPFRQNHQLSLLNFKQWLIHICRQNSSLTRKLRITSCIANIISSMGFSIRIEHIYQTFSKYLVWKPWHHRRLSKSAVSWLSGRALCWLDAFWLFLDLPHRSGQFTNSRPFSKIKSTTRRITPRFIFGILHLRRSDLKEVELHLARGLGNSILLT